MRNLLDDDQWKMVEADLASLERGEQPRGRVDPALASMVSQMPMLGVHRG